MGSSFLISIVLVTLFIAALPVWKYSRIWGGGYTPCGFLGFIIAAHVYTMMFVKTSA
jgi:hypothetical protein